MKVTCDPRKITVSQTNLGKALGLTTGRVAQLMRTIKAAVYSW